MRTSSLFRTTLKPNCSLQPLDEDEDVGISGVTVCIVADSYASALGMFHNPEDIASIEYVDWVCVDEGTGKKQSHGIEFITGNEP